MAIIAKVKIIHVESEEVLFECPLSEIEKAYKNFAEYEDIGLDVKIIVPSAPETLASHLDLNEGERALFKKSLEEEIDSHDESCCYKLDDLKSKKVH